MTFVPLGLRVDFEDLLCDLQEVQGFLETSI